MRRTCAGRGWAYAYSAAIRPACPFARRAMRLPSLHITANLLELGGDNWARYRRLEFMIAA